MRILNLDFVPNNRTLDPSAPMPGNDQPRLNQLLHWAVENTPQPSTAVTAASPSPDGDQPLLVPNSAQIPPLPPAEKKKLDTAVLDAILGKTNALRMREAMDCFDDPSKSLQERCAAAEMMEELAEDLDNANDMEILGFWPRLLKLIESSSSREEDELIKFHACWICGTAVQNNPKSQIAFSF